MRYLCPMKYREYKSLSLTAFEEEVLKFWAEHHIFEKSVQSRPESNSFIFYEGPPSANGMPGIHHVMARTVKDLVCRYKTLQGYRVERKGGWDTHGLPVELQVEKELGITKEDIGKTISVEEYNAACRRTVMRYKEKWDELTIRMGYWVDLDNPYITFENRYIESLWDCLRKLYDKGLLYKGYTIQPYSPAAGTGLSSHELNLPGCYRQVKDTSAVAMFLWVGTEEQAVKSYFLAWTTTPWTLPANTALAVGADIEYAHIETLNPYTFERIRVVLAADLVSRYFKSEAENADFDAFEHLDPEKKKKTALPWKLHTTYKGAELVGKAYHPVFEELQLVRQFQSQNPQAFRIIAGDFVSTEDGTGIVHISPTFGADDYRVATAAGIPGLMTTDESGNASPIVDKRGRYVPAMEQWAHRYVKTEYSPTAEARTLDVDLCIWLKEKGRVFRVEKYEHSYPHCWRTDKPVLYYPLDSWFIRTTAAKTRMIELNQTINWKPESTGTGRFGNWLENLVDWNLSRSRFWGTPLPIWRTEDGSEEYCIGSLAELREHVAQAVKAGLMEAQLPEDFDLHRPYVDRIILVSPSGKPMYREPDLIDVWFDSGAMPYAQWGIENQKEFGQKAFPADFIAEGVDQTRGWFFTLHALAVMLYDSVAFKNVISNGLVLDKDGNKMSKRLGNAIDPFETMQKYGADATRWYMIENAAPWENLKFNTAGIEETQRKFFGTLYNTYNFFAIYANLDGFEMDASHTVPMSRRTELDRWIISRLHTTLKTAQQAYDSYEPTRAARAIQDFVTEDLSNWYVRLSRKRFWKEEMSENKKAAYETLFECLLAVSQMMSPIAPFIGEWLYKNLTDGLREKAQNHHSPLAAESVHLTHWMAADLQLIDSELESAMALAQKISSLVHSIRKKEKIKVRTPLQRILIPDLDEKLTAQIRRVEELILAEVNVKRIDYIDDDHIIVKKAKPNFPVLSKRGLGKLIKPIQSLILGLSQSQIADIERGKTFDCTIEGQTITLTAEDLLIESDDIPGWSVAKEGAITVALDITLTDELRHEGIARDLVNRIQNLRKDLGMEVQDKIRIEIESHPQTDRAIEIHRSYICTEVQAVELAVVERLAEATALDLDDFEVRVRVRK